MKHKDFADYHFGILKGIDACMAKMDYCNVKSLAVTRADGTVINSSFNTIAFKTSVDFEPLSSMFDRLSGESGIVSPEVFLDEFGVAYRAHLVGIGIDPNSTITAGQVIKDNSYREKFCTLDASQVPTHWQYGVARAIKTFPELVSQKRLWHQYCSCSTLLINGHILPLSSVALDLAGADLLVCRQLLDGDKLVNISFVYVTMTTGTHNSNDHYCYKSFEVRSKDIKLQHVPHLHEVHLVRKIDGSQHSIGGIKPYKDSCVGRIDSEVEFVASYKPQSSLQFVYSEAIGGSIPHRLFLNLVQREMSLSEGHPIDLFAVAARLPAMKTKLWI